MTNYKKKIKQKRLRVEKIKLHKYLYYVDKSKCDENAFSKKEFLWISYYLSYIQSSMFRIQFMIYSVTFLNRTLEPIVSKIIHI